jgi:hypothetical protein
MNKQQVEEYLKLQLQMKSTYDEIAILSKKKPADTINLFKLKLVNNILERANVLLKGNYKPFPEEFSLFNSDDMPTNSDVVFMLSHYLTALEKLRCDNIIDDGYSCRWKLDGEIRGCETSRPKTSYKQ